MGNTNGVWQGKASLVYEQLRSDIESGRLAPGQSLPEVEIVEYTGASRTPVREALRRLALEGLVDILPRRAPTVSQISLQSARALFDFRRLLEAEAIERTTTQATEAPAIREVFVSLRERFMALQKQELDEAFADAFQRATDDFDSTVAAAANNDYLSRAVTDLRPHSTRLRQIAHGDRSRLQESVSEHIEMCEAVIAGEPGSASAALRAHLDHVEQAIFRQLLNAPPSSATVLLT